MKDQQQTVFQFVVLLFWHNEVQKCPQLFQWILQRSAGDK